LICLTSSKTKPISRPLNEPAISRRVFKLLSPFPSSHQCDPRQFSHWPDKRAQNSPWPGLVSKAIRCAWFRVFFPDNGGCRLLALCGGDEEEQSEGLLFNRRVASSHRCRIGHVCKRWLNQACPSLPPSSIQWRPWDGTSLLSASASKNIESETILCPPH
jgi:hypothetical protein